MISQGMTHAPIDGNQRGAMAPFGGMPELFFRDPQQLDSVERYNVVYRRPE